MRMQSRKRTKPATVHSITERRRRRVEALVRIVIDEPFRRAMMPDPEPGGVGEPPAAS